MIIREARPADGDAIRALVAATLAEFGFPVEAGGADSDLDDVPLGYQRRGGLFRVIVDEDVIVGCGGLYPVASRVVELRKMYFHPSIRGRGLGRRLLEDLIDEARRHDFTRIELETASSLTAAIGLYQSAGFIETKGPTHSNRGDRTFALDLR
ncbi:MAG TPA: GNAT family N-acetyltransferase [Gemmatimonadaceae bacterium]|nr:GNAT family N-acetyltransferase [Gemmatimonadaceae bacterium]